MRYEQQAEEKKQMIIAGQNMFHTQRKEIPKRTSSLERGGTRLGIGYFHYRAVCGCAQQPLEDGFPA